MAEVTSLGGFVSITDNGLPRESGISEVFAAHIFPIVVAVAGGIPLLAINQASPLIGPHVVFPGVRQGVLTDTPGGLVDFTEWVWKIRYLPWCYADPPIVRGSNITITPYSNDPTGREITLSINWGDGTPTTACMSGVASVHSYASSGRYTTIVRATNQLGDSAALSRDVLAVDFPDANTTRQTGGSPGGHSRERDTTNA
jgi:hypothetical protein